MHDDAAVGSLTVVLVRHAERVAAGQDPSLSEAGRARAELLALMLADASISAVYVTDTARSRQTGEPTAAGAGADLVEYEALDASGCGGEDHRRPSFENGADRRPLEHRRRHSRRSGGARGR